MTKSEIDCPSTGEPIRSHPFAPSALTYLLYVISPVAVPETISEENSLLSDSKVTDPLLVKLLLIVIEALRSMVKELPLATLRSVRFISV